MNIDRSAGMQVKEDERDESTLFNVQSNPSSLTHLTRSKDVTLIKKLLCVVFILLVCLCVATFGWLSSARNMQKGQSSNLLKDSPNDLSSPALPSSSQPAPLESAIPRVETVPHRNRSPDLTSHPEFPASIETKSTGGPNIDSQEEPSPEQQCGTCDSENSELWNFINLDHIETPWTKPGDLTQWRQYYKYQDPEAYYSEYLVDRDECEWNNVGTLGQWNFDQIEAQTGRPYTEWNFLDWQLKEAMEFSPLDMFICTFPAKSVGNGVHQQKILTRITGFTMELLEMRQGMLHLPLPEDRKPTDELFVIENLDAVFDGHGKSMDYPPFHSHHGSAQMRPGNPALKYQRQRLGDMLRFDRYSSKFQQRMVDHLGCASGDQNQNACHLFRHPSDTGWAVDLPERLSQKGQMYQQSWKYNQVGKMEEYQRDNITLEFMRVFEYGESVPRHPVWTFDLQTTGNGAKYHPIAGKPRSDKLSVIWHVFEMPIDITFRTGFVHTHAQIANELFIIMGNIEDVINEKLKKKCYDSRCCCERDGGSFGGCGQGQVCLDDMLMGSGSAESASIVLQEIIDGVEATDLQLKCQFKSRNTVIEGKPYTQTALISKSTFDSCHDFTAPKGSYVSLVGISHPPTESSLPRQLTEQHLQHLRWFVSAQFDLEEAIAANADQT